jgi:SAM-dependent methyltransferase
MNRARTSLRSFTVPISRFIRRRTCRPSLGGIVWGDLRKKKPISANWGFDRGLPIDRYYIDRFLANCIPDIKGHVLEIADDQYTRRFGGDRVTKSDILHDREGNPAATLIGDLQAAPHLQSEKFDCIICTQTFQFIYDLPAAIETLHRLLKPGGILLASIPGISKIERFEGHLRDDYWRFTTASARRLFESKWPASEIDIQSHGNIIATVAFLHGLAAQELSEDELDFCDANYQTIITIRAAKPPLTS